MCVETDSLGNVELENTSSRAWNQKLGLHMVIKTHWSEESDPAVRTWHIMRETSSPEEDGHLHTVEVFIGLLHTWIDLVKRFLVWDRNIYLCLQIQGEWKKKAHILVLQDSRYLQLVNMTARMWRDKTIYSSTWKLFKTAHPNIKKNECMPKQDSFCSKVVSRTTCTRL